jgi:hypothetical protein
VAIERNAPRGVNPGIAPAVGVSRRDRAPITVYDKETRAMGNTPHTPSKLPAIAFTCWPATGETVAILRGHATHYRVGNAKSPDELNRMYGVSRAQERAMLAGALHGWGTPLADPDRYAADGGPPSGPER